MNVFVCLLHDITQCYVIIDIKCTKCLNFFSDAKLGRPAYILQDSQFV